MKVATIIFLLLIMAIISNVVIAEENFGVKIYPGAVLDSKTAKAFSSSSSQIVFYTTNDDVAKVFAFYKKQPGLKPLGEITKDSSGKSGAAFTGDNIMITIERPHMDMTTATLDKKKGLTGKMINNTLISIQKY